MHFFDGYIIVTRGNDFEIKPWTLYLNAFNS